MTHEDFTFESFRLDRANGQVFFVYSCGENHFEEILSFPSEFEGGNPSESLLIKALFYLHLAIGVSYYKAFCSKKIVVKSGVLSQEEAAFFNKLYTQGLGEFFYKNKIDPRGLVNFPWEENAVSSAERAEGLKGILLPLGGGKDSLVSAQLLKKAGFSPVGLRLETHSMVEWQAAQLEIPLLVVKRQLSPRLFELNREGAPNGHVPISAILAFLSMVISLLSGFKWTIFSNERSANTGNVRAWGMEINHQYSKSLEFEQDFRGLVRNFLSPDLELFSLLRPLSELHITALFCEQGRFLDHFSSCNRNFKIGGEKRAFSWCGECPKCAFVFVLLAAFCEKEKVLKIFGKNLLGDESLWPLFKELLGVENFKPFECVGEPEEVRAAFEKIHERGEFEKDALMKFFLELALPKEGREALFLASEAHFIPQEFQSLIPRHDPEVS